MTCQKSLSLKVWKGQWWKKTDDVDSNRDKRWKHNLLFISGKELRSSILSFGWGIMSFDLQCHEFWVYGNNLYKKLMMQKENYYKRSDYFLGWFNVVLCNQIVHKNEDQSWVRCLQQFTNRLYSMLDLARVESSFIWLCKMYVKRNCSVTVNPLLCFEWHLRNVSHLSRRHNSSKYSNVNVIVI